MQSSLNLERRKKNFDESRNGCHEFPSFSLCFDEKSQPIANCSAIWSTPTTHRRTAFILNHVLRGHFSHFGFSLYYIKMIMSYVLDIPYVVKESLHYIEPFVSVLFWFFCFLALLLCFRIPATCHMEFNWKSIDTTFDHTIYNWICSACLHFSVSNGKHNWTTNDKSTKAQQLRAHGLQRKLHVYTQ